MTYFKRRSGLKKFEGRLENRFWRFARRRRWAIYAPNRSSGRDKAGRLRPEFHICVGDAEPFAPRIGVRGEYFQEISVRFTHKFLNIYFFSHGQIFDSIDVLGMDV